MSEHFTIESDRLRIIKGEGDNNSVLTKRIVDEMFETMDTVKTIGGQVSSEMLSQILHKSYFIEIGGDICTIEKYAFSLNDFIEKVRIDSPAFAFSIGEQAFYGCSNLKTLEIDSPLPIVSFGDKSFCKCFNLTNVELICPHVQLYSNVFSSCKSLKTIRLPGVHVFGSDNFAVCESLDSIYIPRYSVSVEEATEIASLGSGTNAKIILFDEFNEYVTGDITIKSEPQNNETLETASTITPQTSKSAIKSYNGVIRTNLIANKKNNKS